MPDAALATAIVLAGHGSRSAQANAALVTQTEALAARVGLPAFAAFLEMTEPSIPTAIEACISAGARRIVVVPYFLHPGMHVSRDIVAIVDSARAAHPAVTIGIAAFLGAHPGIGDMLADITQQALAGHRRPEAV